MFRCHVDSQCPTRYPIQDGTNKSQEELVQSNRNGLEEPSKPDQPAEPKQSEIE